MRAIALLTAFLAAAVAPQAAIDLRIASRAIAPGELLIITIVAPGGASELRVHAFDHVLMPFLVAEGKWQALVGIDLEQPPGEFMVTAAARAGERELTASRTLSVHPKQFSTRTLRVEPDFVDPPPDLEQRIADEVKMLPEVYAHSAPERLWRGRFVRPVPQRANSAFGARSIFNGERRNPHAGTDFLSPAGTRIKAPNAGRIVLARELYFTGNTIVIDHGLGMFSMLAHLSRLDVREGDTIEAGHVVGLVGATGRVTGPHLHWGLRVGDARVNPLSALALLGRR